MTWNETFESLYNRCLALYNAGNHNFTSYYTEEDLRFLASIGYQPREFFDFIEDYGDSGSPAPSTALLIASIRRDYFIVEQKRKTSEKRVTGDDIPGKLEQTDGTPYLSRIIHKAEAKLRGELDPNLMFLCGGDRNFLKKQGNIHPADFLRRVWIADGDHKKVIDWIKAQSA